MSILEEFKARRERANARVMEADSRILKRIYGLDSATFRAGALDEKTKELLGLVASMVLRCEDCVKYHIDSAVKTGATEAELVEVFEIATLIGGTIVIPELRKAFAVMDDALGGPESV